MNGLHPTLITWCEGEREKRGREGGRSGGGREEHRHGKRGGHTCRQKGGGATW